MADEVLKDNVVYGAVASIGFEHHHLIAFTCVDVLVGDVVDV